jgi:rhodanese-related sulfurtransferase
MEMVQAVKCPIYQSAKSGVAYDIEKLTDGSALTIGNARLEFLDTPGHTPDGGCLLVYGKDDTGAPKAMFTGDVLFVGSVGRPDLMGGTVSAAALASAFFDSWNQKIAKLDDTVMVLPAHGAGSLCGAHLSDEPFSTIGKEKLSNPYLQHKARGEFIAALLEGIPEAPQYFKHNAKMNKQGPPLVDWKAPLPALIAPTKELMEPEKAYVVDVRDVGEYAKGHIPNAINIGVRGRLETWVGIMISWGEKLALCGNSDELHESLKRLHRVGYKADVITMAVWEKSGLPVTLGNPISPKELYRLMQEGKAPVIVDVRLPKEWMALRIGQVLNLPLNHLSDLASQLDPAEPVVTVCNSAYRSSMAVGILERRGFTQPRNLEGGSAAWIAAGYPVFEAAKGQISQGTSPKRTVRLPERMSAAELKRLLMDLPNTFELVDIRPPEHFNDFHLPGSVNVDVADMMANPGFLVGVGPLIIVDRDGSIAMAVGGILSQKAERPIKVLYGGLQAYWSETQGMAGAMRPIPLPTAPAVRPSAPKAPQALPPAAPAKPEKPTRKSAGC